MAESASSSRAPSTSIPSAASVCADARFRTIRGRPPVTGVTRLVSVDSAGNQATLAVASRGSVTSVGLVTLRGTIACDVDATDA